MLLPPTHTFCVPWQVPLAQLKVESHVCPALTPPLQMFVTSLQVPPGQSHIDPLLHTPCAITHAPPGQSAWV